MSPFINRENPVDIEDHFGDVLAKAQMGLGISSPALSEMARVDPALLRQWRRGVFNATETDALAKVASALQLQPQKLTDLAAQSHYPDARPLTGLAAFNLPFGADMTVNAYVIYNATSREAIVVDTGLDAGPMLAYIAQHELQLRACYLTHGHRDHIGGLSALCAAYPDLAVMAHPAEAVAAATPIDDAPQSPIEGLSVTPQATPGHSPGGISYVITGLEQAVCICGDALFCQSVGGIRSQYTEALEAINQHILSLPENTQLYPGHGPISTVAFELAHNAFFKSTSATLS